jgi:hypothetical protein
MALAIKVEPDFGDDAMKIYSPRCEVSLCIFKA